VLLTSLDVRLPLSQFFYRKLKPEVRPICQDPEAVVSIADCRLMAFDTVSSATKLWIKGRDFTIEKLLGPYGGEAAKFSEGAVGVRPHSPPAASMSLTFFALSGCFPQQIFRLAPQDYHRFHVPVDGKIGKILKVEGAYYTGSSGCS
jgi:phosphatidylserine decarboxylase